MSRRPFPARKPADWPALDRHLWEAAQQPAGFFDEGAIAARWSPATRRGCERGYGLLLAWLEDAGDLDPEQPPQQRITRARLERFIADYAPGRAPLTIAAAVRDIALTMRAMIPPTGLPWLSQLGFRMVNRARPVRPKLPRMASIPDILDAADKAMSEGLEQLQDRFRDGAVAFRDALLLAFLAHRPLRVRNLSHLRIGDDFHVDDADMRINVPASATKKGVPYSASVPAPLTPALTIWLNDVRPRLIGHAKDDPGWLWLTRRGNRLTETQIAVRIRALTRRTLGRDLSPHLLRDCAATQVALDAPAMIGITKDILGHATLASSQQFYNQATSFSAFSAHDEVIRRLREGDGQ